MHKGYFHRIAEVNETLAERWTKHYRSQVSGHRGSYAIKGVLIAESGPVVWLMVCVCACACVRPCVRACGARSGKECHKKVAEEKKVKI